MTTKRGIIEGKKKHPIYNGGKDTEKELMQKIQKQNGLQSANALAELMRRNGKAGSYNKLTSEQKQAILRSQNGLESNR
tara:strand:- start:544 stop:780 length:237 start_codon:yes stop_codon:yes gene_type:complete